MTEMTDETAREKARELYLSDDIDVDKDAALSRGDDGVWVAGWLWVPYGTDVSPE